MTVWNLQALNKFRISVSNWIPAFAGMTIVVLIFLSSIKLTYAANEFSSSYDVTYSVSGDGITEVIEKIKLKNLTDKFFPSSFSLILPGGQVSEIEASDKQGRLETEISREGGNTKLVVKFTNQQIIGLGKEYDFILKFKDQSIARHLGKVWSINIPKITQQTEVENFNLTLSVPTSFGDPDYIMPKPAKTSEVGGKINFIFDPHVLSQTGISATFGNSLNFSFESNYPLQNNSIFPKFINIPIAFDSGFQKTFVEDINPRPENTNVDNLGNILATFKLNPGQTLDVKVRGQTQTFLNSLQKELLSNEDKESFLEESKFWDKNNAAIKAKLEEILESKKDASDFDKAYEINRFVSNFLQFDSSRIQNGDFARFGSVTALNNPEKALASEFVDLEIALLRAAGIPARQVVGFSIPQETKPFSFQNTNLHSWVEFYDSEKGWLIADPAWQNTTRGANFFNYNDLSHLGLALVNGDFDFVLPNQVEAKIFDGEAQERKGAELDINVDSEILSGFPAKAKIIIRNIGNSTFPSSELKVDTSKILVEGFNKEPSITQAIRTPEIPPFGTLEYDLNLKTGAIWHSYQDVMQVSLAEGTATRVVTVKPILSYRIYALEMFGGLTIILLFYILTILVHHKSTKKN